MPSIENVEQYIKLNKHLSDIPTEKEVQSNGVEIGEMQGKFLRKIEELTLYIIEQNKRIQALETQTSTHISKKARK